MVFFKKDESRKGLIEREAPKNENSEIRDIVEEAVENLEKMYPEGHEMPKQNFEDDFLGYEEMNQPESEAKGYENDTAQQVEEQPTDYEPLERGVGPQTYEAEEPPKAIKKVIQPKEAVAPLFVKVDKYGEILSQLQEIKMLISGIKAVFPLLVEVDAVERDAIDTLRTTLQKIEKNVVILDSEFLRPGQMKIEVESPKDVSHIEDSLAQLQRQLSSLKNELQMAK